MTINWIAMYVNGGNVIYIDSLGAEYIPKEIKILIANKNIKTNVYRIQATDSIIIITGKSLLDNTN